MSEKQYLGDGVFILNDGWHVILETERDDRTEKIYLEPQMIRGVVEYAIEVGLVSREGIIKLLRQAT